MRTIIMFNYDEDGDVIMDGGIEVLISDEPVVDENAEDESDDKSEDGDNEEEEDDGL